jgi:membrane associated rhomboid family serine protease
VIPLYDLNPTRRLPLVTVGLIVVNAIVYLLELLVGAQGPHALQELVYRAGLVPVELLHGAQPNLPTPLVPPAATLLTSMFMHGSFLHIAGNMLYLWIFGDNVEDQIGPIKFVFFYLLAGVAAAGLQVLMSPESTTPMVGASGAIAGVLGAYLVCWPSARVRTLVFLGYFARMTELPASLVLGFWFVLQLIEMALGSQNGVAVAAHVGGFVFGALVALTLIRPFMARRTPDDFSRPY